MYTKLSRREMMRGSAAALAAASAQVALPAWMPRLAFAPAQQEARGDVLISIFLRGGADMLNMVGERLLCRSSEAGDPTPGRFER
jgi:uncharacterized protein (DUF1501 family)